MNTLFLKKVDGIAGSLLTRILPGPFRGGALPDTLRRVLLVRPGGIGDAVLLVPAIRALKNRFPGAEITVLAERRNGAALGLCPDVSHVLFYDCPRQLAEVMRRRYDVVIDTEQWHRLSAVVSRLIRSDLKIGFATNERKRLFHAAVPYSHEDYEAESFLGLMQPLGVINQQADFPFLQVPSQIEKRVGEVLAPLADQRFVVLFPGASVPERRWGLEEFHRLAIELNKEGCQAVVVGGSQDRGAGKAILTGCRGINLAGRTSLVETAAVLQRSRLLITGDSGVLHMAVGLDVPTVSLFGPGIAAKWAPRGKKHIVLSKNLDCSPCTRFGYTPPCPEGGRCIQEISVDEVVEAVRAVMDLKAVRRNT